MLHKNMSLQEFDDNYYYLSELQKFAASLGIATARLRKLELEAAIRGYLSDGKLVVPALPACVSASGRRDVLHPGTRVVNYVDDKQTKQLLLDEVSKIYPDLKMKSGQWYWLNDWRREQLADNKILTYAQLAGRLAELMATQGRLPQIPSARFNNFVTDYLADSQNAGASKQTAVGAWFVIKKTPGPKTYAAYCRLPDVLRSKP